MIKMTSKRLKDKKVPNLRFPGFDGEWETKKLGEICEIYDGTHQTPNYVSSGIPFYSVEHITSNNFNKTKYITLEVFEKEIKRVKIEKADILMTRIGDIGTSKYIDWNVKASFYVSLALIKQSKFINSIYLNQFISTNFFQKELWDRTIHVAFPKKINLGEIGKCLVNFPTEQEQRKIATFLTLLDKRIQTQNKIIEELDSLKVNISKKVFSQELQFKEETKKWKEVRLDRIATFFSGGTPLTSKREFFEGDIPFIRSGEINSYQTEQFISELGLKKSSAKMVEVGDVLYALYGATSGEVGISKIKGAINQAILCIRSLENNYFIYSYLLYKKESIIATYLQGGQGNLSAEIVKQIKIPLPPITIQNKIATILMSIDNKIILEKQMLNSIRKQKQYLLKNLFV